MCRERDPNPITDMAPRDERRDLFRRTFGPMVW